MHSPGWQTRARLRDANCDAVRNRLSVRCACHHGRGLEPRSAVLACARGCNVGSRRGARFSLLQWRENRWLAAVPARVESIDELAEWSGTAAARSRYERRVSRLPI